MKDTAKKRNITTEKAMAILKENGVMVDEAKAGEILDFLYFLAELIVSQHFRQ